MFHWICPECGSEIPPAVRDCLSCEPLTTPAAPALATAILEGSAQTVVAEPPPLPAPPPIGWEDDFRWPDHGPNHATSLLPAYGLVLPEAAPIEVDLPSLAPIPAPLEGALTSLWFAVAPIAPNPIHAATPAPEADAPLPPLFPQPQILSSAQLRTPSNLQMHKIFEPKQVPMSRPEPAEVPSLAPAGLPSLLCDPAATEVKTFEEPELQPVAALAPAGPVHILKMPPAPDLVPESFLTSPPLIPPLEAVAEPQVSDTVSEVLVPLAVEQVAEAVEAPAVIEPVETANSAPLEGVAPITEVAAVEVPAVIESVETANPAPLEAVAPITEVAAVEVPAVIEPVETANPAPLEAVAPITKTAAVEAPAVIEPVETANPAPLEAVAPITEVAAVEVPEVAESVEIVNPAEVEAVAPVAQVAAVVATSPAPEASVLPELTRVVSMPPLTLLLASPVPAETLPQAPVPPPLVAPEAEVPVPKPSAPPEPQLAGLHAVPAWKVSAKPDARPHGPSDTAPHIILPGPTLPPALTSLSGAGLTIVRAQGSSKIAVAKAAKRTTPWVLTAMVTMIFVALGIGAVTYFTTGSSEAEPPLTPTASSESPNANPAAASPASLSKQVEVTGFRMVAISNKTPEIHYLVVNHSAANLSNLNIYVTLRLPEARPGQPPFSRFSFRAPELGPFEAREMVSAIERIPRQLTLPEWQNLKADVEIAR